MKCILNPAPFRNRHRTTNLLLRRGQKKGKGKNNFPHQTSPEGTLTSKNIVWKLPDPYSCDKLVVVVESHFHFIKGLKIIVC